MFNLGDKVKFNSEGKLRVLGGDTHPFANIVWKIYKVSTQPDKGYVHVVNSCDKECILTYVPYHYFNLVKNKKRNLPGWF